jgi:elongation factor G
VLAHVFKVMIDPFVGKVGVFRVHQGTITKDTQLFIGDGRKPFKVGHAYLLQGKDFVETSRSFPATSAPWPRSTRSTSTRCCTIRTTRTTSTSLPLEFPDADAQLAMEPKRRGDEQRISDALHKIAAEDPTFRVEHNAVQPDGGQRLGDLHMRYILDKMRRSTTSK